MIRAHWITTCLALCLLAASPARAEVIRLTSDGWAVEIDPETLKVDATTAAGKILNLSAPDQAVPVANVESEKSKARWSRGTVTVHVELNGRSLSVKFRTERPGKVTWPIVQPTGPMKAIILPTSEGVYVPVDDVEWQAFLAKNGPIDTTAGLSMPFWGIELGDSTLTYLVADPFNNELAFTTDAKTLGLRLSHEFLDNQPEKRFEVIVQLTEASPVAPARAYRQHLIDQGVFVSMKRKIEQTPNAARLLGAAQIYVWGDSLLSRYDVSDWQAFAVALKSDRPAMKRLLARLHNDAREQIHELAKSKFAGRYAENLAADGLSKLLAQPDLYDREAFADVKISEALRAMLDRKDASPAEVARRNELLLVACFPGLLGDPSKWGDGISTKMLDRLHDAKLDRVCISTGDLSSARLKPHVAARANELGYLFGPYDAYDSVQKPGDPDGWETAQFDQALYETGAVIRKDGTPRKGFRQKGFYLSPIAARPYLEKRVSGLMAAVPFTSWFMDCDAFGEVPDDYSPLHPANAAQMAQAKCDRLAWVQKSQNVVVGSEGGTAFAAPYIHFSHGVMTPVIGWGDKDLTGKDSPYYLGKYWPPSGPDVFLKPVPLKPYYQKFHFDPRYRLPLYQTVFHDSIVTTHHWSAASLKFSDQARTNALLELLYNVPPLYHLNLAEWKDRQALIVKHFQFFSPLHRRLGLEAMTEFEWLTPDRLVQRTTFGDKTTIIANFSEQPYVAGEVTVPPMSISSGGVIYTP